VITQEQADQIKDHPSLDFGAPGHSMRDRAPFGDRRDGPQRQRPSCPDTDTDDTSGTHWQRPGRTIQEDSTL
jgi:hypothetical protein